MTSRPKVEITIMDKTARILIHCSNEDEAQRFILMCKHERLDNLIEIWLEDIAEYGGADKSVG